MKSLLAILLCLACCGQLPAQTGVLFLSTSTLIDSEFVYGINHLAPPTKTARTLSSTNRALLGVAPGLSHILFPADGTITTRTIHIPSTLTHSSVSGLTIKGQYAVGQGSSSVSNPDVAHGIENDGAQSRIRGNVISGFKGACVRCAGVTFVRDNDISAGFTGVYVNISDCMVTDNWIYNIRDNGIHVATNAGVVYAQGNHVYGCNNSTPPNNVATSGAACRVDTASDYRAVGDIYADSFHGVLCGGSTCEFTNCFFQHNTFRDVLFTGAGNELHGCVIKAMKRTTLYPDTVSVEFAHERCAMLGGTLEMTDYIGGLTDLAASNNEGIRINGNLCTVECRLVDVDNEAGTVGINIVGARNGTRINCRVAQWNATTGWDEATARLLKTSAACKDLVVEFHGDFADLTNPGTESAGIKKYIDVAAGWTGSIKFVDISDGTTVTLTDGGAY